MLGWDASVPEKPEPFKNKIGSYDVKGAAYSGKIMRRAARAHHEGGAGQMLFQSFAQAFRHGGEAEEKAVVHAGDGVSADGDRRISDEPAFVPLLHGDRNDGVVGGSRGDLRNALQPERIGVVVYLRTVQHSVPELDLHLFDLHGAELQVDDARNDGETVGADSDTVDLRCADPRPRGVRESKRSTCTDGTMRKEPALSRFLSGKKLSLKNRKRCLYYRRRDWRNPGFIKPNRAGKFSPGTTRNNLGVNPI